MLCQAIICESMNKKKKKKKRARLTANFSVEFCARACPVGTSIRVRAWKDCLYIYRQSPLVVLRVERGEGRGRHITLPGRPLILYKRCMHVRCINKEHSSGGIKSLARGSLVYTCVHVSGRGRDRAREMRERSACSTSSNSSTGPKGLVTLRKDSRFVYIPRGLRSRVLPCASTVVSLPRHPVEPICPLTSRAAPSRE